MVDGKQITIGVLTLLLLVSGIIYIQMNNVKLRVDYDKSTFYVKLLNEEGQPYGNWLVSGKEYNRLFSGTKILNRNTKGITIEQTIDGQDVKIVRTTPYQKGPVIKDTYTFRGDINSVELFPISHKVEIYNATGYLYRYTVDELKETGIKRKLINELTLNFGLNMKVELQQGYSWAWIGWPYGTDSLSAQYAIKSDYQVINVRLFDPPKQGKKDDTTNKFRIEYGPASWKQITKSDDIYAVPKDKYKLDTEFEIKSKKGKILDTVDIKKKDKSVTTVIKGSYKADSDYFEINPIYAYQNDSRVVYETDNFVVNNTLKKWNGEEFVISPDDIFIRPPVQCDIDNESCIPTTSYKFGAIDSIAKNDTLYQYEWISTKPITYKNGKYILDTTISDSWFFTNNFKSEFIDVSDICTAEANCVFNLTNVYEGDCELLDCTFKHGYLSVDFIGFYDNLTGLIVIDPAYSETYTSTSKLIGNGTNEWRNRTEATNFGVRLDAPVLFMDFNKAPEIITSSTPTYALNFDGVNEMINIGTWTALNGATSFSICMWLNKTDTGNFDDYRGVIARGTTNQRVPWLNGVSGETRVAMAFETTAAVADGGRSWFLGDNVWEHGCFTWDGSNFYVYDNNVKSAADTTTGNTLANIDTTTNHIAYQTGYSYWKGGIDDIVIWKNRVLTDAEVSDLYNSGNGRYINPNKDFPSTGKSMGDSLTHLWRFDEGSGTSAADSKGGVTGTLSNMEAGDWVTGKSPVDTQEVIRDNSIYNNYGESFGADYNSSCNSPAGSGCYMFDGVNDYIQTTVTQDKTSYAFWYANKSDGAWTHIVNSSGTLYVNGVVDSPAVYPLYVSGNTIQIGKKGASSYFNGSIDQVQIFDRALSADEILNLYNGTKNNSGYIGKYANNGYFRSLVFYNATSSYWNNTLSVAVSNGSAETYDLCNNDANCVSYWDLNERYTDQKGSNDGTPTGTNNATGISSGAMRFDGADDIINVGDCSFWNGISKFTTSMWIKPNVLSASYISRGSAHNAYGVLLFDDSANYLEMRIYNSGNPSSNYGLFHIGRNNITLNQWNHVVVSVDLSTETANFYINSVDIPDVKAEFGLGLPSSIGDTADVLALGNRPNLGQDYNGILDEVVIYNDTLTASEVQSLYKAGLSQHANTNISLETRTADSYNISDAGLVGLWALNGNGYNELGTYNGTITGATYGEDYGVVGGGYSFDGSDYVSLSPSIGTGSVGTVSAWVYPGSGADCIVGSADDQATYQGLELYISNLNIGLKQWGTVGGETAIISTNTALEAGRFNHLVWASTGTEYKLYVNGVEQALTVSSGSNDGDWYAESPGRDNFFFGQYKRGGEAAFHKFAGKLDEVRVYTRLLSASEIQNLYELGSYHIEWNDWQDEGIVTDAVPIKSTNSGKFYQAKYLFNTNDTDVSSYLLNHSVSITDEVLDILPNIRLVSPANNSVLERTNNATLVINVSTALGEVFNVSFYNSTGSLICENNTNFETNSKVYCYWNNLEYATNYAWYVNVTANSVVTQSTLWQFTPNDEPRILNLRIADTNASHWLLEWNNEADMQWFSGRIGSDVIEVRRITGVSSNWSVSYLVPDYLYDIEVQIGDDLNSMSDLINFNFRTYGWNSSLTTWPYRRLITINSSVVGTDQFNVTVNITLNETNFKYFDSDNWVYYPSFKRLNYTNGNDIRFLDYYDYTSLPYTITNWNVPGQGCLETQVIPDEYSAAGSWTDYSNAHDGDWNTNAIPNTYGEDRFNYTIPANSKNSSLVRIYAGEWFYDQVIPEECYNGGKLKFFANASYTSSNVTYFCELADESLEQIFSAQSRYIYETQIQWAYSCDADISILAQHWDDDRQANTPGADGDYDIKFWMYYGLPTAAEGQTTLDTDGYVDDAFVIGSEKEYSVGLPVISNLNDTEGRTATGTNISWDVDQVVDNRLRYATNQWLLNYSWASRIINTTEYFNKVYTSTATKSVLQLDIMPEDYIDTVIVQCNNSLYDNNYTINLSANPVELVIDILNISGFLNWNITYTENKTRYRNTNRADFKLDNLPTDTVYYYEANAYGVVGNSTDTGSFALGTPPSTPAGVFLNYTENRSNKQVTICFNITDLDGAANVDFSVQYWNSTEEYFSETSITPGVDLGQQCKTIDTEYGNMIYYRAKIEGTTTGYSDAYNNLFLNPQEFFAGSYITDDDDNLDRQYCPPLPDGTVNTTLCYNQTGYREGSQRLEDWIYIETNITGYSTPYHVFWNDGITTTDYPMDIGADFSYLTLYNLDEAFHTFYVKDDSGSLMLNWTKPGFIHRIGENRTDIQKYVSFNASPTIINYTQFYFRPNPMINTSAFRWCQDAPGGNLFDCMAVQYWGTPNMDEQLTGTVYDRGELFRGGVWNGEIYDTGVLEYELPLDRERSYIYPSYDATNSTETRFCYAFTDSYINESIYPTNNITNYYVRFWQEDEHWSDYLGYTQSVTWDFVGLTQWAVDTLTYTRDWLAQTNTKDLTPYYAETASASTFNSVYDQRLAIASKENFQLDAQGYEIYEFGFQTDGQWNNIMTGKYQRAFIIFNYPDNATLAGMDTDNDGLSDYDEMFVYYTDPNFNDTDEGGSLDGAEVAGGLNPNIYTDDETIAPRVDILYPVSGVYYNVLYTGEINVSLNESGGNCSINDTTWAYSSGNRTFFSFINTSLVINKRYDIKANCYDRAGNNASSTAFFIYDTVYPTIDFESPTTTAGSYNQDYIESNISSTDNIRLDIITSYVYNGSGLVYYSNAAVSPFYHLFDGLIDGTYYLNATACDYSNNCNSTATRIIILNTAIPILNIESPLAKTYLINSTWFNVSVNNIGGECWFSLDGSANHSMLNDTANHWYNYTENIADGYHSVQFWCNDSANANGTASREFAIDTVPPIIELHAPLTTAYYNYTSILFNYTPYPDSFNVTSCELWGNWSGSWILESYNTSKIIENNYNYFTESITAENIYKYNIMCNDSAGVSDWSQQGNQTFVLDLINPRIIVLSPKDGEIYYTEDIYFNATGNEAINEWSIDYNGTLYYITINTTRKLLDGIYNLVFYGRDLAGNLGYNSTISFEVELQPTIQFNLPTTVPGLHNQDWIFVNLSAYHPEGIIDITYYIYRQSDGVLISSSSSATNFSTNVTGLTMEVTYILNATATSTYGNKKASSSRIITLTSSAPPVTEDHILIYPQASYTTSLWFVEFGLVGSGVPAYDSGLCGLGSGSVLDSLNYQKISSIPLTSVSEKSTFGDRDKVKFGLNRFPVRRYANTYRVFFNLNNSVSSGGAIELDVNMTDMLESIGTPNIDESTYRLYRISTGGGIYNDTGLCLEQPLVVG